MRYTRTLSDVGVSLLWHARCLVIWQVNYLWTDKCTPHHVKCILVEILEVRLNKNIGILLIKGSLVGKLPSYGVMEIKRSWKFKKGKSNRKKEPQKDTYIYIFVCKYKKSSIIFVGKSTMSSMFSPTCSFLTGAPPDGKRFPKLNHHLGASLAPSIESKKKNLGGENNLQGYTCYKFYKNH